MHVPLPQTPTKIYFIPTPLYTRLLPPLNKLPLCKLYNVASYIG